MSINMSGRWENLADAARDAYEAYGNDTDWKSFQGARMPAWRELPPKIQHAWGASVRRILAKAYRIMANDLSQHIQEDCRQNIEALEELND